MTTFDTLTAARDLEDAGMDARQAAAVTAAIRDAAAVNDDAATKADLEPLATKVAMAELETRMTRTLYGVAAALLAGQLAAVLALLGLLG